MKVLVVEDDIDIKNLIEYFLSKENYDVKATTDGLEAIKIIKNFEPDIIVLDLMIPGIDGMSLTQMIRDVPEKYGTPRIIMLTAKTDIDDVIEGLNSGADDYIRKPFDPRELILRIKKITDRTSDITKKKYTYKKVCVDTEKHIVKEDEKEIELSKKEYDLFLYLLLNVGIALSREKILDKVWGADYFSGDRTVDVYIGKLREKVKSIASDIKTVKGVGYKLKENK